MPTRRELIKQQQQQERLRKQRAKAPDVNIEGDDDREPLMGVVVGRKGIGKTFFTIAMIKEYVLGDKAEGKLPRRVLIFDVNNEFTQFRTIALKDIKRWSQVGRVEVRRVSVFKTQEDVDVKINNKIVYQTPAGKMTLKEMANCLFFILEHYHNGLLLIEDINKYVSDSLPNDLIGAICTQRHVGVDVIMHFQSIGKFGHPKIIANANWLRYHKCSDSVGRHEDKFLELTEPLQICERLVNRKYKQAYLNKRNGKYKKKSEFKKDSSFHIFWDNDEEKIKGDFTKVEFAVAVMDYMELNYNKVVKPKLNEVHLLSGKAKYPDRKTLLKELIQHYIFEYYGN